MRSSSNLRLDVHVHSLTLDRVYDTRCGLHGIPAPTPDELDAILVRRIAPAERLLDGPELDGPELDEDEDEQSLARAYLASTRSERDAADDDPHDFGCPEARPPSGSTSETDSRSSAATCSGRRSRSIAYPLHHDNPCALAKERPELAPVPAYPTGRRACTGRRGGAGLGAARRAMGHQRGDAELRGRARPSTPAP